jgi:hypothetical protein
MALFRKTPPPSPNDQATEAEGPEGDEPVGAEPSEDVGPSLTDEEIAARSGAVEEEATRPRLFGFLRKRAPGEANAAPSPTEVMLAEASETAPKPSLSDEEIAARSLPDTDANAPPARRGFLGFLRPGANRGGADTGIPVSLGGADTSVEGFGLMMRACGVTRAQLGSEVGRSPGAGTYKLYDTKPNTPEPRIHYVTGFKDGCPRQFFAALALFGSPVVHEAKRYDPSNKRRYSLADDAYERVKGRTCGVGRGEFCPEGRLDRLGRDVALLTAYPSFGGATAWLDVVLYRGELAGQAVEE